MSAPRTPDLNTRVLRNGKTIPMPPGSPIPEDNDLNETITNLEEANLDDVMSPKVPSHTSTPRVRSPQVLSHGHNPHSESPRVPSHSTPPYIPTYTEPPRTNPYFNIHGYAFSPSPQDARRVSHPPIRGRGRGRGRGNYHGKKPLQQQYWEYPQGSYPQQQQSFYNAQDTWVHPSQLYQNKMTTPVQFGQFPDWNRIFPPAQQETNYYQSTEMPRNNSQLEMPRIINSEGSELNPSHLRQQQVPQPMQQIQQKKQIPYQNLQNRSEIISTKLRLPNFSGKENDWSAFKSQFALMAGTLGWSDKEKLLQLMTALDGRSRSYINNCFTDIMTVTWEEVIAKLENRFRVKDTDHYRSMLFAQKFKNGDNIVEHTDALRNLARKAFPTQNQEFLEDMVKTALYKSVIDKDLSKYLSAQRITMQSVEDVETAIQGYQRIEGIDNSSKQEYRKPFFKPYHKVNVIPMQLEDSDEDSWDPEYEQYLYYIQNKLQKRRDFSKINCHHCGGKGHFQNECPSKTRTDSLNGRTSVQKPEEGSSEKKSTKDQ